MSSERFTITKPFRLEFDATICAEVPVTVAVAGVEAVSGVLVLTCCVPPELAPIPGLYDI
jgi:hypothetical protein